MKIRPIAGKILAFVIGAVLLAACISPAVSAGAAGASPDITDISASAGFSANSLPVFLDDEQSTSPAESLSPSPSESATASPSESPSAKPTKTVSCIFIGDSTTDRGAITGDILQYQADSWLKVKLLGSRGTAPNNHEGRSGWSARHFISYAAAGGIKNSFYNPRTKLFDFPYYMSKHKYKTVTYVFINLGINDVFSFKTDKAVNAEITRVLKRYDQMIAGIHRFNRHIKIGVCITIPPTNSASGFRTVYGNRQTLARYQRNNNLLVTAMKKHFSGQESKLVYLVNIRDHISRSQIVGVHPTATGYSQIASYLWSWLQQQES